MIIDFRGVLGNVTSSLTITTVVISRRLNVFGFLSQKIPNH